MIYFNSYYLKMAISQLVKLKRHSSARKILNHLSSVRLRPWWGLQNHFIPISMNKQECTCQNFCTVGLRFSDKWAENLLSCIWIYIFKSINCFMRYFWRYAYFTPRNIFIKSFCFCSFDFKASFYLQYNQLLYSIYLRPTQFNLKNTLVFWIN